MVWQRKKDEGGKWENVIVHQFITILGWNNPETKEILEDLISHPEKEYTTKVGSIYRWHIS